MIEGLLAGLQLGDTDRIYWVDVLPNERLSPASATPIIFCSRDVMSVVR